MWEGTGLCRLFDPFDPRRADVVVPGRAPLLEIISEGQRVGLGDQHVVIGREGLEEGRRHQELVVGLGGAEESRIKRLEVDVCAIQALGGDLVEPRRPDHVNIVIAQDLRGLVDRKRVHPSQGPAIDRNDDRAGAVRLSRSC